MPRPAPSKKDRKGHKRARMHVNPVNLEYEAKMQSGWVVTTITRQEYYRRHAQVCPICIENARLSVNPKNVASVLAAGCVALEWESTLWMN